MPRCPGCCPGRRRCWGTSRPRPAVDGVRPGWRQGHTRILDGRQSRRVDACRGQQLDVPVAGVPVEQARPGRRRGAGGGVSEQSQLDVFPQRHEPRSGGEHVRTSASQPAQPRRQVAGVNPGAGALLHLRLVQLAAQLFRLGGAASVGVGVAGGQRPVVGVDGDQRGGEGVERDAADASGQRGVGAQLVQQPGDLLGDLVGVDLGRAVVGHDEAVRHLDPAADRTSGAVEERRPRGGRADVDGEDEGIAGFGEGDLELAAHFQRA